MSIYVWTEKEEARYGCFQKYRSRNNRYWCQTTVWKKKERWLNLMSLVARWRQKSLPKSVITSRASVLLIKAVVPCRGCPRSLVVLANNSVFQQNRCSVTISLKNRAFDRKHWENALRKRSPQVPMDRQVRVLTCEQALSLGERSEPRENVRASGETSPHACHSCMYFSRYPPNGELARRLLACVAGTRK